MHVVLIRAAALYSAKLDRSNDAEVLCEGLQQGQLLSYELLQVGSQLPIRRIARLDALDQTTQCRLAAWKWLLALNALAQFGHQLLCSRGIDARRRKFDALYPCAEAADHALRIAQERILKVAGSVRWIELRFTRRVKRDGTHAARYRRVNE